MGDLNVGLGGIVLLSEGFTTDVPRARERRLPDLQGLVRAASRFRVLFYAFDPEPSRCRPCPRTRIRHRQKPTPQSNRRRCSRTWLGRRAAIRCRRVRTWDPRLRRVSRDLDSYYVADIHRAARERWPLSSRSGHGDPARRAGARAIRLLGAAAERTPSGDGPPQSAADLTDARPAPQPVHRVVVRPHGRTWRRPAHHLHLDAFAPAHARARQSASPARRRRAQGHDAGGGGAVRWRGRVRARAGNTSTLRPDSAVFQATPGRLQFDLTILQADGSKLDVGAHDFDVPTLGCEPGDPSAPVARAPARRASSGTSKPMPTPLRFPVASSGARSACCCASRRSSRRATPSRSRRDSSTASAKCSSISRRCPQRQGERSSSSISRWRRSHPVSTSIEVAARSDAGTARELIRFRITG